MTVSADKNISLLIKEKSRELGFDLCGIAPSRSFFEREEILNSWCSVGMNAGMGYLARDIFKRLDPKYLLPDAKSLIVTGLSYFTNKKQAKSDVPVLSKYAYGKSYQDVITSKLENLLLHLKAIDPAIQGRAICDSAPLLEKAWAVEAGLGWQGRHSVVINKEIGSFFFIGILILNYELEYDKPFKEDYCGSCRLCVSECPTSAINENRTIDARKCIANLTIENRGPIPEEIIPKIGGRVYGCDVCQDVCPWNIHAKQHHVPEFILPEEVEIMTREEWLTLSPERFSRLFIGTPLERRKYEPFMRNVTDVTE